MKRELAILDLFKQALAKNKDSEFPESKKTLLEFGYVCDKNVDHSVVLKWVRDNHFNPNTTFYETIEDVISKDRLELFLDQILNYFTSYNLGMDHPFIVNDKPVDLKKLNVTHIKSISEEDVIERCQNMLYSGVALKQETIEKLLLILEKNFDINEVKNKEAQAFIAVNEGVFPEDAESSLRCLIYQVTGKTLMIKDKATIEKLKKSDIIIPDYLIERFSKIFFRFKPLFLALKKNNAYKINRMRRMANNNKISFKQPFWNKIITVMETHPGIDDTIIFQLVKKNLKDINVFRMVSLYNSIQVRLVDPKYNVYVIRNGKVFAKVGKKKVETEQRVKRLTKLKNILFDEIVKTVKNNIGNEIVELPLNINLACPTSEKNFMGEIPIYSWIDMNFDHSIIGINWKETDGARDLDLSFVSKGGYKIGWNSDYYDDSKEFVYSGDMTTANPEATELLYKRKSGDCIGIVHVNPYAFTNESFDDFLIGNNCGRGKAKYKVFFAKEEINAKESYDKEILNYMVNPDNIIYYYDDIIEGEKVVGTFLNNKFIFVNLQTSYRRVSDGNNVSYAVTDNLEQTHPHYLTLDKVLKAAQVNLTYNKEIVLSKDYILKLFEK